ncbi:sigma-70 family RNA polymerase sigma factor [Pseudothauera nasutitermitis]|uniref:Sigma-70 family RNA polymerase sigma factor n=1 Tax=Pseudothauera nasutitermitis TaxID=2565930 RepID=A0A4S4B1V0_9RHOO|nr:sigma-70 family RNA polymerase sigma factor [Pseudothauera nasutitermitis]THF66551.1 sigma-70 family RNA polymerase sigma factor [Pseudothauera nasutitermitis]
MNTHLKQEIRTLYTDHQPWLQGWLSKKTGCMHLAADLLHDTFMRLLSRQTPIEASEPRAFLTTVAKRVFANHLRRQRLEQAYLQALAALPESLAPSAEESVLLFDTLDQIDRMLDGLPPLAKRAFLLCQLDGLSQSAVAAELGISLTTVKRYLVAAGQQCYFAALNED